MNCQLSDPSINIEVSSLLHAYRNGKTDPVRVIKEVYRRIALEAQGPIWTYLVPESSALDRARDLMERSGENLALFGIPFSVKDNIHIEGLPTTAGCSAYLHYPEDTATVVTKMIDAGAILIGKNSMDQFATGLVGIRSDPHPRNSFNSDYIPGGSSSGSAIAVARRLVSFSLASDTGGSGRVPAALNNIVGLKPTPGIISSHGMVYANRSFDCVPIFALTCEDANLVFNCAIGEDEKDPFMRGDILDMCRPHGKTKNYTVGIPRSDQLEFFGDTVAEEAFSQAISTLERMGATLVEIDFSPFLRAGEKLFSGAYLAERLASVYEFIHTNKSDMHPVVANVISSARKFTAVDFFTDYYELRELRSKVYKVLEELDLIMVPTAGTIYTVNEVLDQPLSCNSNMGYYTYFSNLLELSALAMPASIRPDGLPFGVCFLSAPLKDYVLLDVGRQWQKLTSLPLGAPERSREELCNS